MKTIASNNILTARRNFRIDPKKLKLLVVNPVKRIVAQLGIRTMLMMILLASGVVGTGVYVWLSVA